MALQDEASTAEYDAFGYPAHLFVHDAEDDETGVDHDAPGGADFWRVVGSEEFDFVVKYPINVEDTAFAAGTRGLAVISLAPGTPLAAVPLMPGASTSMVYWGAFAAIFCWHVEDGHLQTVSYLHAGAPKLWFIVASRFREPFQRVAAGMPALFEAAVAWVKAAVEKAGSKVCPESFEPDPRAPFNIAIKSVLCKTWVAAHSNGKSDHEAAEAAVRAATLASGAELALKRTFFDPRLLLAAGVPVTYFVQLPGTLVILDGDCYHGGWSIGLNTSEATNFSTEASLARAAVAAEIARRQGTRTAFSEELLLVRYVDAVMRARAAAGEGGAAAAAAGGAAALPSSRTVGLLVQLRNRLTMAREALKRRGVIENVVDGSWTDGDGDRVCKGCRAKCFGLVAVRRRQKNKNQTRCARCVLAKTYCRGQPWVVHVWTSELERVGELVEELVEEMGVQADDGADDPVAVEAKKGLWPNDVPGAWKSMGTTKEAQTFWAKKDGGEEEGGEEEDGGEEVEEEEG
jgi:hypothetical protein